MANIFFFSEVITINLDYGTLDLWVGFHLCYFSCVPTAVAIRIKTVRKVCYCKCYFGKKAHQNGVFVKMIVLKQS
jgi:hypothetical protein